MGRKKIDAFDLMSEIAGTGFSTVSDIREELVVPTLLTGYNRALGTGGHVSRCITLIHGPNQKGKTILALSIAESMRLAGFVTKIYDSEFAANREWYGAISPKSGFEMVDDLDCVIKDVDSMLSKLEVIQKKRRIKVGCCFVADTLTKLFPRAALDKIQDNAEKMFPVQANMIALWLKSLVGRLYRTNSTMVIVAQERENLDPMARKKYKISGGKAIQYDNRLRVRVDYSNNMKSGDRIIGSAIHYVVENNKITGSMNAEAVLFTSLGNGKLPKGLDLYHEAVEEGKLRGVVTRAANKVKVSCLDFNVVIEGGWETLVDKLMCDGEMFNAFVRSLNAQARTGES